MHELRNMLKMELEKITKSGDINPQTLDYVDKLTHSIKSIDTIMAMQDAGYSNDYNRGNSYARRRDSMGRYADNDRMYSRRGYSRDNLMSELGDLENEMHDEESKQMIRKWMREAQNV